MDKNQKKKKKKKTQTDRYTGIKAAAEEPENQNMTNLCPDSNASLQEKNVMVKNQKKKEEEKKDTDRQICWTLGCSRRPREPKHAQFMPGL